MERRLLLAIVLSFIVVFASNFFMTKNMPKTAKKNEVKSEASAVSGTDAAKAIELPAGTVAPAQATDDSSLPPAESLKEVTVRTKLFTAVFTNYGARLKTLKLNEYKVEQKRDSELIDLVGVAELTNLPLDVHFFTTENVKSLTGNELFNIKSGALDLVSNPTNNKLEFSCVTPDGLQVTKIFTFSNDRYNIDLDVQIKNSAPSKVFGKMNINWIERFTPDKKDRASNLETFAFDTKEVKRATYKDLEKAPQTITGAVKWSGFLSKFFLTAFIPEDMNDTTFFTQKLDGDLYLIRMLTGNLGIDSGETKLIKYSIYLGPKMSANLKPYGVGLQSAINFGFFSIIAIPLMEILQFFYRYTHNYGIAIIFLTIIIKIIFFPLTQKSYKAMKDMQKVAPLINELKEKYKDDKERLNKEVLELYRRHRVNPVGGCFPVVLQMPVFFALYQVLLNSVELRHAPFYFWITDLSSKDPYYITPVIMGVTMLIQQKMSPTAGDKNQQKIMLIMPIVFTFMFANFPAGLVIYWLVNNIISIFQQGYVIKKS